MLEQIDVVATRMIEPLSIEACKKRVHEDLRRLPGMLKNLGCESGDLSNDQIWLQLLQCAHV